jgi:hypothetical protein
LVGGWDGGFLLCALPPHPVPLPQGEGNARWAAEFAVTRLPKIARLRTERNRRNPLVELPGETNDSLSPRERVGVRGNRVQTLTAGRFSATCRNAAWATPGFRRHFSDCT